MNMKNLLNNHFANKNDKVAIVLVAGNYGGVKLKEGDILNVIGRNSKFLHESRQGYAVIRPSGRGELLILDCWINSGDFEIKSK